MEVTSIVSSQKGLRRGAWAKEEDLLLRKCIIEYGEGKWHQVPLRAGLNRCRKSCRLRWLNYLQPNIKRGEFEPDEVDLIIRMHKLLGNRWSLIAGRIPGRTANDIKNYYNTHLKKTCFSKYNSQVGISKKKSGHDNSDRPDHDDRQIPKCRQRLCPKISTVDLVDDKHKVTQVLRPRPRSFKTSQWNEVTAPTRMNKDNIVAPARFPENSQVVNKNTTNCVPLILVDDDLEHFSNDQQTHNNSTDHRLKNIVFPERDEEEELVPKKKKPEKKKRKKRVTPDKSASLMTMVMTIKMLTTVEHMTIKGKKTAVVLAATTTASGTAISMTICGVC